MQYGGRYAGNVIGALPPGHAFKNDDTFGVSPGIANGDHTVEPRTKG